MRVNLLGQEAERIEKQIETIDEQVRDLEKIKESLSDIEKLKEDKEILSNLGKGIFLKTYIKEKKPNLLINVGDGIILEKNIEETSKVINEQL